MRLPYRCFKIGNMVTKFNLKEILELILKHYNGEDVEFNVIDVVADLYDVESLEAQYLASLIEHEPAEGGLLGISSAKMKAYRQEIIDLAKRMLEELSKKSTWQV